MVKLYYTTAPVDFSSPTGDYLEDRIDLNELLVKTPSAIFIIKVHGNSMVEAFIPPKGLLVVNRPLNAKNRDIIILPIFQTGK